MAHSPNGDETADLEIEGEEAPEEPEKLTVPASRRSVYSDKADPTIRVLYDQWKEGDLVLQPDFQRQFVWDTTKSSRLIESLLLDLPLPTVYLAEEANGGKTRTSVIDGQQRLTACFNFLDGKFGLRKLRVLDDLNGQFFKDLHDDLKGKVKKYPLRTITIRKESDENLKFELFERLNTGAMALNPQELRNCVYRGEYNSLVRSLSGDPDFRFLLGISRPEKRMRDVELVLRFAAFFHATYLRYQSPMKRFMNDDMQRFQNITKSDAEALREKFKDSVQLVRSLLGEHSFRRFTHGEEGSPDGYWENKVNLSLFDVLMGGFVEYPKSQVMSHLDAVREAYLDLLSSDAAFIDAIELSTSSVKMVRTRFEIWRKALEGILGSPTGNPRCFSRKLKEALYAGDPTCALCGQHIAEIDDAAVDHIKQYWQGGKTIPENARLSHRYCNDHRPRKD